MAAFDLPIDRERVREWGRTARRVLFPRDNHDPKAAAAWQDAEDLWLDLFGAFQVEPRDADVLELGCGDGRVLGTLLLKHQARSAAGLDRAAYWNGAGGGVAWRGEEELDIQLFADLSPLQAMSEASFDLILARELDATFPVEQIEDVIGRLYSLLRPGGEAVLRLRCADVAAPSLTGPGYGFMTPSAWIHLAMRAGFEPVASRPVWRAAEDHPAAARRLPATDDAERMTRDLHLHLIRPWEAWELDALGGFGPRPKSRKPRRRARR